MRVKMDRELNLNTVQPAYELTWIIQLTPYTMFFLLKFSLKNGWCGPSEWLQGVIVEKERLKSALDTTNNGELDIL